MNLQKMLLILTATTTGLMAGLFFAWTFSVMPGLAKLADQEFLAAMQAMNRAIQNPVFFSCFFGAAILLPICTYQHYGGSASPQFWFLLAATGFYLLGVMSITIFANVPLNNSLEALTLSSASPSEMVAKRASFEIPWNKWNNVRTLSALLALILVVLACIENKSLHN